MGSEQIVFGKGPAECGGLAGAQEVAAALSIVMNEKF